jgi:uncharacterized SAM-binding protein YcdF (DUF218 family)
MLFLSLIFSFTTSALLLWKRKTKAGWLFFIFAALLCLGVGQGWVTHLFLANLQDIPPLLQPKWQSKNAIILLGGGSLRWQIKGEGIEHLSSVTFAYSRIHEAARLYRACQSSENKCVIIASGGDPQRNGISEARIMQRELLEVGVSADDILLEEQSRNTFENAKFTRTLLEAHGFSKHILVTSGFHLRRAKTFFMFFRLEVDSAPSDQLKAVLSPLPLAQNFLYADLCVREYLGFAQFHFYNFMGWNKNV